jgi:hypothetical protein
MNLRHYLFFRFVAIALLISGCASFSGPHGFGQWVLLIWKVTPAQKEDAQKRANQYFTQVTNQQKPKPWTRYVAIQTLDPNPKQLAKYEISRETARKKAETEGKPLGSEWVDPPQLHCIMVFDVVTHEAVGTNCYVVGTIPKVGDVNTYESFPAEFVASSAEFVTSSGQNPPPEENR